MKYEVGDYVLVKPESAFQSKASRILRGQVGRVTRTSNAGFVTLDIECGHDTGGIWINEIEPCSLNDNDYEYL